MGADVGQKVGSSDGAGVGRCTGMPDGLADVGIADEGWPVGLYVRVGMGYGSNVVGLGVKDGFGVFGKSSPKSRGGWLNFGSSSPSPGSKSAVSPP